MHRHTVRLLRLCTRSRLKHTGVTRTMEQQQPSLTPRGPSSPQEQQLSKNARKRLLKQAHILEMKAKRKADKKARKAAKRALRPPESEPVQASEEEVARKRSMRAEERRREKAAFAKACDAAPRLIIDMAFEELMKEGEQISLVQQVAYCYSANRRAERPFRLCLHGVQEETERRLKANHLDDWKASWGFVAERHCYLDSYAKDELVYLTADSPNEIENLDPAKSYIVGGIVDHNRLKHVTLDKAISQGITTARLPLDRHFRAARLMGFSRVLTVNHLCEVLLEVQSTGNWAHALSMGVPSRKTDGVTRSMKRDRNIQRSQDADHAPTIPTETTSVPRRVAMIAGASQGIGLGFARQFRLRGWHVVMVARDASRLNVAADGVRALSADESDSDAAQGGGGDPRFQRRPALVVAFPADCSEPGELARLKQCTGRRFKNRIDILVLAAGTFRWDSDEAFSGDSDLAKDYLCKANLATKTAALDALRPLITGRRGCSSEAHEGDATDSLRTVVVVGSQAGKPGFVEEIEAKEGSGAADDERGYIAAMGEVREWSLRQQVATGSEMRVRLLEPGLVDTPLARREFARFNIDWGGVQSADKFAIEVLDDIF